jgi:broad-specificity NMP kinase
LTGVPGVGKTTTSSYFKNLVAYDEWLDRRLPEMGRPHTELTTEQRKKVDEWVRGQVALKNRRLLDDFRERGVGITIVDRCVPDALAFSPAGQWGEKAEDLLKIMSPGQSKRNVHPGHVILLLGESRELSVRLECRGKEASVDYIKTLQEDTQRVYDHPGVTILSTTEMSIMEVVKAVARIIHLQDYEECNLQELLQKFSQSARSA